MLNKHLKSDVRGSAIGTQATWECKELGEEPKQAFPEDEIVSIKWQSIGKEKAGLTGHQKHGDGRK